MLIRFKHTVSDQYSLLLTDIGGKWNLRKLLNQGPLAPFLQINVEYEEVSLTGNYHHLRPIVA